ncbi:MBOAT family protein [uncultured Dysosmobacter sp.]|uniref:MBOAT family O-acyltransferase n=1 Tax=uncultured Dysosmobacter sp. TaxID=2591384 RepID=UPI002617F82F|nr:MBOAT family O-acyltransferase [uncultured Dysosmobacter sp.]
MIFSSLTFLFVYLPLTLAVYFLAPLRWRNLVLLLVSLFFYGWGEPVYILIMFLSIAIDYTHGLLVEKYRADDKKARWFVGQSVIFNLLLLGFFKYWDFLAANLSLLPGISIPLLGIPLPIGISFFTFQTMSYTIDVYRRDAPVQRNIISFGAFVTMFPQLIAGPIVKYKTVAADLERRVHTTENFALGVRRFCVGLAKKVLLANSIGALWDEQLAAQSAGTLSVLGGWMGLLAFGFQIYFDFSGYSDMAIGLGQIFGFRFNENFDYPYLSASVTEFWRRWHMSLTSWFREYLYIPLGGNRGGTAKTLRNILIVWFCTGFWHGASWNFILWGLYFAAWLILEKYVLKSVLVKTPVWLKHLYTLSVVFVGWGIFAIEDLGVCGRYLAACFGGAPLWSGADGFRLRSYAVTFLALLLASTTLGRDGWRKLPDRARKVLTPLLMALSLVLCTAYLVDGSYNPFLYFRF